MGGRGGGVEEEGVTDRRGGRGGCTRVGGALGGARNCWYNYRHTHLGRRFEASISLVVGIAAWFDHCWL